MSTVLESRFSLIEYFLVIKPRETGLLVFIAMCSALIAASANAAAFSAGRFVIAFVAIALGSAGANALTNYLDRDVDARMKRTFRRGLPSGRIRSAESVLVLSLCLVLSGLALAWVLSPLCLFIGIAGLLASAAWRKTISCTFLGIVAGSAPSLIGWYAMASQATVGAMPVLLFLMIVFWTPIHVWTLLISNRDDYEGAGLRYFPLCLKDKVLARILLIPSVLLALTVLLVYPLAGRLGWLYLSISTALSLLMLISNVRLLLAPNSKNALTAYKLSAFPYLGTIFAVMAIDSWLA